ncbi:PepSY domain-containing protein [Sphingobacterium prati]|uniref:PepSY domain-containing protein n=1 Tax=Sphingobacterium prati TaxID=2737006 RepID=UPI0015528191|nr:PepSY domain-containing protein [Sphingobacterium prati]NPE47608.1 FAD-binding oxidoreductase [Sphingobacterium prati]
MLVSVWRYAHLALALVSSVFLLLLSVTGVILAIDAVSEKIPSYRIENIDSLDLSQTIAGLRKVYPEIIEISVDHNQFVSIDAIDADGNTVKGYIDPQTGKYLGAQKNKTQFVQWITVLHRSLFLKVTGRIIIGVASFLLFLITISGLVLIIKRQQGVRHFFAKINRDFFAQYFHVVSGRLFLIPILILALTGTYLFMVRIELLKKTNQTVEYPVKENDITELAIADFQIFKTTKLNDVLKLEFPFMEGDPDEYYVLKLKDRELTVNQLNGAVHKEVKYPFTALTEQLSLDLHTGKTNMIWAIILGLASLNIVFFIYTGFVITFKRTRTKIKNKYKADNAEIIILVGTENGSTLFFANQIHKQLLADGKKSILLGLNQYQRFPNAKHLLLFTSTYGLGTAPSNAAQFEKKLLAHPQQQSINFSVLGFGSKAYPDFCAYAYTIDKLLSQQTWASRLIDLHTVNDKNVDELISWVHHWSGQTNIALASAPAIYSSKAVGLKKFKVIARSIVSERNSTFTLVLKPLGKMKVQSGDLLAIYPAQDQRERFYSIGCKDGMIQLVVKLFPEGFGSGFLYQLKPDQVLEARVMANPSFHFPKVAPAVALIANGTGIAPFLGMIAENQHKIPVKLYAGFRTNNEMTAQYLRFTDEQKKQGHLNDVQLAFSREQHGQYVMDLIRQDGAYFVELLEQKGCILLCGSLRMQQDVEATLNEMLLASTGKPISSYKENSQILTDCY